MQWYSITNLVVNLKYPMSVPHSFMQKRDSSSSNNSTRRGAPPGFEEKPIFKNHYSSFSFGAIDTLKKNERAHSPEVIKSNEKLVRKRPTTTKSTQDWIVPLVTDLEADHEKKKITNYLNEISSKGKHESDSISDELDRLQIKEEDEFDSIDSDEEEKVVKVDKPKPFSSQFVTSSTSPFPSTPFKFTKRSENNLLSPQSYFNEQASQYDNTLTVALPGPDKPVQAIYEYKGNVANLVLTQQGSKYLQRVLTKASPDVVEFIIQEIGFKLSRLMTDQYGNYFCQKLLQSASSQQRYDMLTKISYDFYYIACNKAGTHSIQSLIEMINMDEEYDVLELAISECIYDLSCDPQGTYVVQKIIFCLKKEKLDYIFYPIIDNMFEISKNTHGLSVVKKIISSYKSIPDKT